MNIQANDIVELDGFEGTVVATEIRAERQYLTIHWSTNKRGVFASDEVKLVRRGARWIKKLELGQHVVLKFTTRSEPMFDEQIFLGLSDDEQTAKFCAVNPEGANTYVWEAYRFNGRWCYGSSAQTVGIA